MKVTGEYRGEDATHEMIKKMASEIYDVSTVLSWGECWNEACETLYDRMSKEGLKNTAIQIWDSRVKIDETY